MSSRTAIDRAYSTLGAILNEIIGPGDEGTAEDHDQRLCAQRADVEAVATILTSALRQAQQRRDGDVLTPMYDPDGVRRSVGVVL